VTTTDDAFFDYYCARCDSPFCERVHIMNLALNYLDDEYCLACLAQEQQMDEPGMAAFVKEYVFSRECFQTPWENFDATGCPRLKTNTCYCR
jgi:hypothetical protein